MTQHGKAGATPTRTKYQMQLFFDDRGFPMFLLRLTGRLAAISVALLGANAGAVTVFSYDATTGQLPTDQGWLGFEIDADGPLTAPNTEGTAELNANAAIENVDGANALHLRDTLSDGDFNLPNYYYPWTAGQQTTLINNGLKFTMVAQGLNNTSGNGNVRFGFNGTEFEIQLDNIGADQAISIANLTSGSLVPFPVDGQFHTMEVTGQRNGSDFEFALSVDGGEAQAISPVGNPSPGAIESAVYFGGLSSPGTGTDLLVRSVVMETLGVVAPQVASITRVNGSPYGTIELTNNDSPLAIAGYTVSSSSGALAPANWASIADNSDQDNDQSVDPNDVWIEVSSDPIDLTEFEPDGDGAALATGQSIVLGDVWLQGPTEDIVVELLLDDGSVIPVVTQFDGAERFEFGDLDFDGDFDLDDFHNVFVPGFGASTADSSSAERYQAGDFNDDGLVDEFDFLLYNQSYLAANPGAAALSLNAAPEPRAVVMLSLAAIGLVACSARRVARAAPLACLLLFGAFFLTPLNSAKAAEAVAYWNFDESAGATSLSDQVGANHSTDIGQAEPGAAGQIGGAWTFNNASQAITIDAGTGDLTGLGAEFSFSTWVNSTDNLGVLMSISDNTEGSEELAFRVSDNGSPDGRFGLLGRPNIVGPGNEALSTSLVNDGAWRHVAYTSDASGWSVYVDGVRENSGDSSTSPLAIGANSVHIGTNEDSSGLQWGLSGQLDDMVVWDGPLSDSEVADLFVKGRFGRGAMESFTDSLAVEVNRVTGAASLKNDSGTDFEIDLYRIVSSGDSLQSSGWVSLAGQGFDSSAWTELSDANGKVSEGAFADSTLLASGFSQSLGSLYDTSVDAQDLVLEYHLAGTAPGLLLQGAIEYVTTAGPTGDYNNDGSVNAADYTVWRDTFGQVGADLAADGNNNGSIDQGDYDVWRTNYGATSAAAGSSAAPEPTALALWASAAALAIFSRRAQRGGVAAVAGTLILGASMSWAAVTIDRDYRLGDDSAENGPVGATVGASTGGVTYDSAGAVGAGNLQDLQVNGAPSYTNASGRPGASGGNRGASFDGVDDSLSTAINFHLPTDTWDSTEFFPADSFPHNYEGISAHGVQLWAKPSAAALGQSRRQDVLFDTLEQGVYITENDTWGLWYDLADGPGVDSGVAVDTASNSGWTHVMQLAGSDDLVNGASRQVGALLINGVAVAALSSNTETSNAPLVIGASPDGEGGFANHYAGELDDVRLFLWGDNSDQDNGDGRVGQDWGTLNLGADNDWIVRQLASLGVTSPADINLDGSVSGDGTGPAASDDVTALLENWRAERLVNNVRVGDWISRQDGDLNYDGIVDLRDAGILHVGLVTAGAAGLDFSLLAGAQAPEPAGVVLAGLAIGGLLARRERRRTTSPCRRG